MAITTSREKVLFFPLVRSFFNPVLGQRAKAEVITAAKELGIDGIFPADGKYTSGSICSDRDVREYYEKWKGQMGDIKALIVVGGNFMEERSFQDTLRLLPEDVPAFLIFQNDNPSRMEFENRGDAYCGALSIHRNASMIGRGVVSSRGIDMANRALLTATLQECLRVIDGIESLRHMRVAMVGVNPVEFATTFTNQVELFRLGFSLHPYELLDLWGATVLAEKTASAPDEMKRLFPGIRPTNPITSKDPNDRTIDSLNPFAVCQGDPPGVVPAESALPRDLAQVRANPHQHETPRPPSPSLEAGAAASPSRPC